ncbi:MAG TPA: hypothetical protein PKN00_03050 [Sedimentisphaerales bacterium]|jgi:hypothetical protein|nr:hypothetical protein [Sedimentisphaerales bacterium]
MPNRSISVLWLATLMVAGIVTGRLWGAPAPASESGGAAAEPVPSSQSQTPETVVFDLHYRALTGSDDPLSYHSFWGFGSNPPQGVAFVDAWRPQTWNMAEAVAAGSRGEDQKTSRASTPS